MMQPEKNISDLAQEVGVSASGTSAKPLSMETETAFGNGGSVVGGKGSGKTGWILGLVLLAIIAVGGIGFGVWAYMDGSAQRDALNEQINDLKNKLNNSDDTIINIDTDGEEINTAEYIYLGDWNIKLEIGSELELFNLTHYDSENRDVYAMIAVYPDQIGAISDKYDAAIDNGDSFPTNFIVRSKDATYNAWNVSDPEYTLEPIYNDGEYNYFVYRSSGSILVNMENEADGIMEAAGDMAEILNNAVNYSKI